MKATGLAGLALSLTAAAALAGSAHARSGGIFGRSGRPPGSTCAACHGGGSGISSINFTLAPLNADFPPFALGYVPGAIYRVTVSITGGPAVRNGFNWDADAGTSRTTSSDVQRNGSVARQAEVTHTGFGINRNTWTFEWTAPADRRTVTFWLMGNSTNCNGSTSGDRPTTPVSTQATAAPAEVLARIGNVNDAPGDPLPVLFVNGSRGDDSRVTSVATGGPPMEIAVIGYPGAPPAIPYVIYALRRANVAGDESTLPNFGLTAFLFPSGGGTPTVVANTIGRFGTLGAPRFTGTPLGPGPVLTFPSVPSFVAGVSITLQGLVRDSTAPSGGAVTNAVVVGFL